MNLTLVIVKPDELPPGVARTVTLAEGDAVIGREETADWYLPDPARQLSRRHCRVLAAGGAYWLVDQSSHGTFVNGRRLIAGQRHRLGQGDTIGMGDYLVRASLEAPATYAELLAAAQGEGAATDWRRLRFAYLASPGGDVDVSAHVQGMFEAFQAGDWQAALAQARVVIDRCFVHIDAHIISDLALRRLGDKTAARRHFEIANRLLDSILRNTGESPERAFEVISIAEEYSVLTVLGLELDRQSLVKIGGHHYDRMEGHDREGRPATVYFWVDALFPPGVLP